jgi:hygromycin-B 7''-O-kinase
MALEPQKYTERLGVIEPDQLQDAAERMDIGEVLDAHPAIGGLFGQNLFLVTRQGEFVLRGNPHGHQQLTKERVVAEFITKRSSLPAPWPYEICDDASIFGWTFAIMPRLPGECAEQLWHMSDDEGKIDIAAATGEALGRLHEARGDFMGPYDAQMDAFIEMDDFPDWWIARLEHWRRLCRSIGALSTEAELFIDDQIEQHADALRVPFKPVLVHHDFKTGNINLDPDDDYEPTGVFDLMEAYLADGEEDLVRMLWTVQTDEEREAFFDEYDAIHPLRDGAADRLQLYAMADWMVIWEYGKRNGVWFDDITFMDSLKPILANARKVVPDG